MSQSGKSGDSAKSNGIEDEQKPQKKQAKHDSGAADLEKVTDYVEESELNTQNVAEVSIVITSLYITNTHLMIFTGYEFNRGKEVQRKRRTRSS